MKKHTLNAAMELNPIIGLSEEDTRLNVSQVIEFLQGIPLGSDHFELSDQAMYGYYLLNEVLKSSLKFNHYDNVIKEVA